MSELTDRLRRGVQEYGSGYGTNWNISGADDLMDEAADRIEELGSLNRGHEMSGIQRDDISYLNDLLDEAHRVYTAAESAGVGIEIGHYRRLREGKEVISRLINASAPL